MRLQELKEFVQILCVSLDVVIVLGDFTALLTHGFRGIRIVTQKSDCLSERFRILGRNEDSTAQFFDIDLAR